MEEKPDRPVIRTRLETADLRAAWQQQAPAWLAWARTPGHDSYWQFHRDRFLELVPSAGERTLDLGCGEGRLSRDLKQLGHDVVAVDASPALLAAAREADPDIETHLGDAATLPFGESSFDLVVAFMSLQDIDDFEGAIRETARVLQGGGRFCLAIVHPLNSAGRFEGDEAGSPFMITGSYLDRSYYADNVVRDGVEIDFVSAHRPLQAYTEAIAEAGLLIERLRSPHCPALPQPNLVPTAGSGSLCFSTSARASLLHRRRPRHGLLLRFRLPLARRARKFCATIVTADN